MNGKKNKQQEKLGLNWNNHRTIIISQKVKFQQKLTASKCVRWCFARSELLLNTLVHPSYWQPYGRSPVWLRWCIFKFSSRENDLSQPWNCYENTTLTLSIIWNVCKIIIKIIIDSHDAHLCYSKRYKHFGNSHLIHECISSKSINSCARFLSNGNFDRSRDFSHGHLLVLCRSWNRWKNVHHRCSRHRRTHCVSRRKEQRQWDGIRS